ncbi:MAG: hypothetical protein K9M02_02325 [Thiohalocapsa sp.]|nr:hypothetical protein [Thiohalocapsa sp.]
MTARAPRARGGLPRSALLIGILLSLLALAGVAIAHLYWSGLESRLAQMRESVDDARERQQLLTRQVREAQAALQARRAESERRQSQTTAPGAGKAASAARPPAAASRQGVYGAPPGARGAGVEADIAYDWPRLGARVEMLVRESGRLPSVRPPRALAQSGSRPGESRVIPNRLLRGQLQVAETAVMLRDPFLLDTAAAAAQRLLVVLYGPRDRGFAELAGGLDAVRAALRPAGPPGGFGQSGFEQSGSGQSTSGPVAPADRRQR